MGRQARGTLSLKGNSHAHDSYARIDADARRAAELAERLLTSHTVTVDTTTVELRAQHGTAVLPELLRAMDATGLTILTAEVKRPNPRRRFPRAHQSVVLGVVGALVVAVLGLLVGTRAIRHSAG